jgi:hypothetical protein
MSKRQKCSIIFSTFKERKGVCDKTMNICEIDPINGVNPLEYNGWNLKMYNTKQMMKIITQINN